MTNATRKKLPSKVLEFLERAAALNLWLTLEEIRSVMRLSPCQWDYVLARFRDKKVQVKIERRRTEGGYYEYMLGGNQCPPSPSATKTARH